MPINDPRWEEFLGDPFAQHWPAFAEPLDEGLVEYLQPRIGADCATNHARLAEAAEDALEAEVTKAMEQGSFSPSPAR